MTVRVANVSTSKKIQKVLIYCNEDSNEWFFIDDNGVSIALPTSVIFREPTHILEFIATLTTSPLVSLSRFLRSLGQFLPSHARDETIQVIENNRIKAATNFKNNSFAIIRRPSELLQVIEGENEEKVKKTPSKLGMKSAPASSDFEENKDNKKKNNKTSDYDQPYR